MTVLINPSLLEKGSRIITNGEIWNVFTKGKINSDVFFIKAKNESGKILYYEYGKNTKIERIM